MTEDSATLSYPFPVARRIKGMSGTAQEDLKTWPTIFEPGLGTKVSRYLKRKRAVIEYLSGASDATLKRQYGIGTKGVYRLIRRCLEVHRDGQIYGWRGLVPYARQEPYRRTKVITVNGAGKGAAGALTTVLALEPELGERFNKRILKAPSDDKLEEKRNRTAHWRWLLGELRKKGYEISHEWPFNTENMAYVSVCRYVKAVLAANPTQGAMIEGGKEAQKKMKSGDGVERPVERLLQRVEMDAHKTDGRFCVLFPRGDASYAAKIVHRLWVIVLLEVVSRAVLGYYLSFRYEVSKDDVFRAIKRALTKWQRRNIAFGDEAYYEGAALPSGHNDRYIGVCWDETSVDGALAETSSHVRQVLDDIVGSRLLDPKTSFAVRRSKDDRPFIETFFRHLGAGGFQRLTNTTGGNPKGKNGRDPEAVAVNSRFQVEYAEDMLDILIANYNATEHPSLGGRSPLEYLDFLSSRPGAPDLRYADSSEVQRILSYRKPYLPDTLEFNTFKALSVFEETGLPVSTTAAATTRCQVSHQGRSLEFGLGTVAGMKGETHAASLILESYGGPSKKFDVALGLEYVAGMAAKKLEKLAVRLNPLYRETGRGRDRAFCRQQGRQLR